MAATRLQTTDRADKRDLILRAATLQFNERGFNDTRLEDVAVVLDTSKTSISYHFKSKQALLEQAYAETCAIYSDLLEDAALASSGLARIERWITGLGERHSAILSGRAGNIAFLNDLSALQQYESDQIALRSGEHHSAISRFVEAGEADGSIRPFAASGAAYFIWNIANWIEDWLAAIPANKHLAAIDALCCLLRRGLAADKASQFDAGSPRTLADASSALFNREARARLKKDAFERAGIRAFNRLGYSTISMNTLAKDLGASRGSFYYSFADKDALLECCTDRTLWQFSSALDEASNAPLTAIQKLHRVCTMLYTGHFSDLDPLLRPCLFTSLSDKKRAVSEAEKQNISARLARLVAECFEDDSGEPQGVDKLELILLGTINSLTTTRRILLPGDQGHIGAPPAHAYFAPLFRGLNPAA